MDPGILGALVVSYSRSRFSRNPISKSTVQNDRQKYTQCQFLTSICTQGIHNVYACTHAQRGKTSNKKQPCSHSHLFTTVRVLKVKLRGGESLPLVIFKRGGRAELGTEWALHRLSRHSATIPHADLHKILRIYHQITYSSTCPESQHVGG